MQIVIKKCGDENLMRKVDHANNRKPNPNGRCCCFDLKILNIQKTVEMKMYMFPFHKMSVPVHKLSVVNLNRNNVA